MSFSPYIDIIAGYVNSLLGIIGLSGAILVAALVAYGSGFRRKIRPLLKEMEKANRRLSKLNGETDFSANFEDFHEQIGENPLLKHKWREFVETFIFPDPEDHRQVIRNSQDASFFFNQESLVRDHINVSFYEAFPNYLTGAGILGTFLGLIAGIWLAQKGLSNQQEIMHGLQNLLGGASLAFTTSIVGLFSSIVFSWREKHLSHRLNKLIRHWNGLLDERLEFVTPEQLSSEYLRESKKQTVQLERFNTDLAVSIATALDERVAQRLGPALESLVNAVDGLRSDKGLASEKMIENVAQQFKTSLSETTGTEFESMANTLRDLDGSLRQAQQGIKVAQDTMGETTRKIADDVEGAIQRGTESILKNVSQAMGELTQKLELASSSTVEKLQDAGGKTFEVLTASRETLEQSIDRMAGTTSQVTTLMSKMEDFLSQVDNVFQSLDSARHGFWDVVGPLSEAAQSIARAGNAAQDTMGNAELLSEQLDRTASRMEEMSHHFQQHWKEYRDRFERLDTTLESTFREIYAGVEAFTGQVKSFVTELDNQMAKAVGDLGGAIGSLGEEIENLSDIMDSVRK